MQALLSPMVEEFWKLVNICRSYEESSVLFLSFLLMEYIWCLKLQSEQSIWTIYITISTVTVGFYLTGSIGAIPGQSIFPKV